MGHIIGQEGVRPDPDKVEAILALKPPANVAETRQMLGMVNYLGRFLPNLSQVTRPLNDLLANDCAWLWGPPQQESFDRVKQMITTAPVLAFYELGLPTKVSADASSFGIGGVLMQQHVTDGWKPIAFCSRTLTEAERRYAQNRKRVSGGRMDMRETGQISCRSTIVHFTYRPQTPGPTHQHERSGPGAAEMPALIRMMRFNPVTNYAPGKTLVIADSLSRNPRPEIETSDLEAEVAAYVATIEATRPASANKLERLRAATQTDNQLRAAIHHTRSGWPRYPSDVVPEAREFFAFRGNLSESDRFLLHGHRIVIPKSCRPEIIDRIHDGHQGITRCRLRAQETVWWPGLTTDIKAKVESCGPCQTNRPSQHREPLLTTALPQRPWQRIAADLCELDGNRYLVVVDYYSRWIEIVRMTSTTSQPLIAKLKCLFARFGVPDELVTDNGPQFKSHDRIRDRIRLRTCYIQPLLCPE